MKLSLKLMTENLEVLNASLAKTARTNRISLYVKLSPSFSLTGLSSCIPVS